MPGVQARIQRAPHLPRKRSVRGVRPKPNQPLVRRRLRAAWALMDMVRRSRSHGRFIDELGRSHQSAAT